MARALRSRSMAKVPPWQRPSSFPAPSQGAPVGYGQLGTPRASPATGTPAIASQLLEPAASKVADFTAPLTIQEPHMMRVSFDAVSPPSKGRQGTLVALGITPRASRAAKEMWVVRRPRRPRALRPGVVVCPRGGLGVAPHEVSRFALRRERPCRVAQDAKEDGVLP